MAFKLQLVGRARFRRELRARLERDPELVPVAESSDGDEACAAAASVDPDVVLLDGERFGADAWPLIAALEQCCGGVRVVFCAAQPTAEQVRAALGAGAVGVVGTGQPEREIAAAVRVVAEGGSYVYPHATRVRDTAS